MDYSVYIQLYENLVQPILLYRSGIWGLSEHKKLEVVQNRACRYFLGAYKNSSNLATRGDMGLSSVKTKQNIAVLRLFLRINNLDDNRLVKIVHKESRRKQRSLHSRVLTFSRNNELDFLDNDQLTMREKMNLVKEKLTMIDSDKWKNDIFNDRNLEKGSKLRLIESLKII